MKKKFTIEQSLPATQIWTFEVEAETKEEAIEMIENRDVEVSNYQVINNGFRFEDYEYDVLNVEEITDPTNQQ